MPSRARASPGGLQRDAGGDREEPRCLDDRGGKEHGPRAMPSGRTAENEELLERVHQTHARARSLVDGILELVRSEHLGGARGNARFGEVVAVWAAGTFGVKDSH